ncbi:MAG: hypothetical protein RL662_1626 [Bacteroidota bacterium]|jgi:membrane associated rhomboid family serine protease
MVASIKSLFSTLKDKSILAKLILVNILVFLVLGSIKAIERLLQLQFPNFDEYLEVSSNVLLVAKYFWTLFTYMFVHHDILHLVFNMLMLYWFGKIFLMFFTSKNMLALYILGGLTGAFFYILAFNTVPYFMIQGDAHMIGASASVMAIIFGVAFYNKNLEVSMLFFGQVKIVYIALGMFILDFIALGRGSNLGGHVAHIGGAALGYLFATQYLRGKDITKWFNSILDTFVNLFTPKAKMRVTYTNTNNKESDANYNSRKHNQIEEIDCILDKIKKSGYASLSDTEKKRLFDASRK